MVEGPAGRIIDLYVLVLEATGSAPEPDPIYWLAGGPGQGASGAAPFLAQVFSGPRIDRDLVFVDYRGTGRSDPLTCPPLGDSEDPNTWMREFLSPERYRSCLPELMKRGVDLGRYNTAIIAGDLEVVRRSLGHEQINLAGASYGSRVGLEYIRRHGDNVRAALLEGVAARFQDHLLTQAELLERGIVGIKAQCRDDAACHAAFPHFASDMDSVLSQLRTAPIETTVVSEQTGREHPVTLTYESFVYALRFSLYYSGPAADLPMNVTAAANGDWTRFADMAVKLAAGFGAAATGMTMAVRCAEVVPYTNVTEARQHAEGTVFGTLRLDQELEICRDWPRSEVPADLHHPVESDVQVLMLTGEWDITSPPEDGRYAERYLPNGRFVEMPQSRHDGTLDTCMAQVRDAYFRRGDWRSIDLTCLTEVGYPPFRTAGRRTCGPSERASCDGELAVEDED